MRRGWVKRTARFRAAVGNMGRLAWHVYPLGVTGIFLLDLAQGLVPLASAWITKLLFDLLAHSVQGAPAGLLPPGLLPLLAAQAALAVTMQGLPTLTTYLNAELGRRLTLEVELRVYQKINTLPGLEPFEDPRFQDTINLAASGAQRGPAQLITLATSLLRGTITILGFLGVLLAFNPLLAGVVSLAVLPQLYARLQLSRQHVNLAAENSPKERQSWYYRQVLSGVAFAKEVRLFNLGDYFLAAFRRVYVEIHHSQRRQQLREMRWQSGLAMFGSGLAAGVFVLVVLQVIAGRLSLGDLTLYTSAVSSVYTALSTMIVAVAATHESALFYSQFTDLLALAPSVACPRAPRPVPALTQGIVFRNVSFRYSDQQPWVLCNINLSLPAGSCLALVGLNGMGKTTLVKLLTRLYDPTEGQILWDGIDLREFNPWVLRSRMGAIFQDFARYEMTAQENIGLGDVAAVGNGERVRRAAEAAGIHDVIDRLPQRYETILSRWLGDTGMDLSGGEWQKMALARMFMREADLQILDEPTAALDAQAEYELYSRFAELMDGRTSLLISHRFSTVRMADYVAVLEAGEITEYGTHEDLLGQGGAYARLYRMQAAHYQDLLPSPVQ